MVFAKWSIRFMSFTPETVGWHGTFSMQDIVRYVARSISRKKTVWDNGPPPGQRHRFRDIARLLVDVVLFQ